MSDSDLFNDSAGHSQLGRGGGGLGGDVSHRLGDMFWAKVGVHPWWPCMIYYSPDGGEWFRIGTNKKYHVQFFGPLVERAWVVDVLLLPYNGRQSLESELEEIRSTCPDRQRRDRYCLSTKKVQEVWNASWQEAEIAYKMSLPDRIQHFGRVYIDTNAPAGGNNSKDKQQLDADESPTGAVAATVVKKRGRPPGNRGGKKKRTSHSGGGGGGAGRGRVSSNSNQKRQILSGSSGAENSDESDSNEEPGGGLIVCEEDKLAGMMIFLQGEPTAVVKSGDNEHETSREEEIVIDADAKARWESLDLPTQINFIMLAKEKKQQKEQATRVSGRRIKPNSNVVQILKKRTSEVKTKAKRPSQVHETEMSGTIPPSAPAPDVMYEIQRLILSPSELREQPVCRVCEALGAPKDDIRPCRGFCSSWFHTNCLSRLTKSARGEHHHHYHSHGGGGADDDLSSNEDDANAAADDADFICPDCVAGRRLCGFCPIGHQRNEPLISCEQANCQRHYHLSCLQERPLIPLEKNNRLKCCPAHFCWSCKVEDCGGDGGEKGKENKKHDANRFIRCVRCPLVFHSGDLCVPAGSVELSLSHIVCPNHLQSSLILDKNHRVTHPSGCFICSAGITNVHCDKCPALFHSACLNIAAPPPKTIITITCEDCRIGRVIRYGQCVWSKVTGFRWWPSEVIHPRNAPFNILKIPHKEGSFPVHFFGADDYQWVSRGRVFPYEIGRRMTVNNKAVSTDSGGAKQLKAFNAALTIIPYVHQLYVNLASVRVVISSMSADPLPGCEEALWESDRHAEREVTIPPYNAILQCIQHPDLPTPASLPPPPSSSSKVEVVDGGNDNDMMVATTTATPTCNCHLNNNKKILPCTLQSQCQNVLEHVECQLEWCSVDADKCRNRHFFHSQNSPSPTQQFTVIVTSNRGYGLRTQKDFQTGDFVGEYVGEIISTAEATRRLKRDQRSNVPDSFMLSLDGERVVDAARHGNLTRFINHSCLPNMETQVWRVGNDYRIGLFAIRPIVSGEELTYNYNEMAFIREPMLCLCGVDNCQGYIGLTKSNSSKQIDSVRNKDKQSSHSFLNSPPPPTTTTNVLHSPVNMLLSPGGEGGGTTSAPAAAHLIVKLLPPPPPKKNKSAPKKKEKLNSDLPSPPSLVKVLPVCANEIKIVKFPKSREEYEDMCYRCGDGGDLILCDKQSCPKSYHLSCVGMANHPNGIWYCPWHMCAECGRPAAAQCSQCPNSFCLKHIQGQLYRAEHKENLYCLDHNIHILGCDNHSKAKIARMEKLH